MFNVIFGLIVLVVVLALICNALWRAKAELAEGIEDVNGVLKIQLDHPGNDDHCYIHLNVLVNNSEEYTTSTSHPDERHPAIFHDLIKINGVDEIGFAPCDRYAIAMKKGKCFEFDADIFPRAIELVKKYYGKGKEVIMLETRDNRENARIHGERFSDYDDMY